MPPASPRASPGARLWDNAMARARADLDWARVLDLPMDTAIPGRYRESSLPEHANSFAMCGKMGAVRNMNRVLAGKTSQLSD